MIKPVRTQRSRIIKQVSPNGLPIVYVGRPSKWGNPYKVGDNDGFVLITERSVMIELYRMFATKKLEIDPHWLDELKGKNLSCWCGMDESCHADVLLELANESPPK